MAQLNQDFANVLDDEVRRDKIADALSMGMKNFSAMGRASRSYDDLMSRVEELLLATKNRIAAATTAFTNGKSEEASKALSEARAKLVDWSRKEKSLNKAGDKVIGLWYRPSRCPIGRAIDNVVQDFDAQVKEAKRLSHKLDKPATTVLQTATVSTVPLQPEAILMDVTKYVATKFSGKGDAAEVLQAFRIWQGKWKSAEEKLNLCLNCSPEVLHHQIQQTLEGPALAMVSRLPVGKYAEAKEALTAKYGDVFQLPASYMPAPDTSATKTIRARLKTATAMVTEVELLFPELQSAGISPVDFLCPARPGPAPTGNCQGVEEPRCL